ncbi:MBL fold metallo-hydrolase [Glaciecola petra]|uniref:MBL fold metallo-hydrolase n=1 Tax=Glaciecola petra TaxID=3075602 RepID=A0ABU2ZUN9_9ALTE|nr:MBL fold metallo-hydrolase [Aestuariibacter sp. P117]MDT0596120.1 MBL fold metallo-hydrolase [Aestuariibacter sp. P117]
MTSRQALKTNKRTLYASILLGATLFSGLCAQAYAQADRFANVQVSAEKVADSVYMLVGSGGNIGASVGQDGLLIIDDQYAPLAEKIATTLSGLTEESAKYVINTHYHGDHTGSNAFFAENQGATIFAHDNVRIRLASNEEVAKSALPVVTYDTGIKFHFNGDTIHVFHLSDAHTDGDSAIYFEKANVLHTGDLMFNAMFPYVDLNGGGDVKGYIAASQAMLDMINDNTKVIPGHGPLASKADLQKSMDMIKETYAFVQAKKKAGMSEEQVLAEGLDEKWASWSWRFITEEFWIKTLYQ